jgi:hypothetical protein
MKQLFKRCSALLLALAMLLLSGCVQPNASTPGSTAHGPTQTPTTTAPKGPEDEYFLPKEEGCNQITFYWNYDGDAATSSFWIWPEGGNGYSYLVYECGFGLKCMVNIPKDVTRIGFIAIHGCSSVGGDAWPGGTKDYDVTGGTTDPSGIDAEKSMANGAKIVYMDTNNSTNDFHERNFASLTGR